MAGGIFDNKILDYLPGKLEALTDKILTATQDGVKYPRFNVGGRNLDRVFGNRDVLMDSALSTTRGQLSTDAGRQTFQKIMESRFPGFKLDPTTAKAIVTKNKHLTRENLPGELVTLLRNNLHTQMLADPERRLGGMSVSRFLGHAAQTGGIGAAALSVPYVNKRRKQLREVDKRSRRSQRKSANTGQVSMKNLAKTVTDFFGADDAASFYTGRMRPSTSYSPLVWPAGMIAAMGAYGLTKNQILRATDRLSDRKMQGHENRRKKELSDIMRADLRKGASYPGGSSAALLSLWAVLAPLFYKLGKGIGRDTTDAAQYHKLENALDDVRRRQPTRFQFTPSTGDKVGIRPGNFLGETIVDLPVADRRTKKREDRGDDTIFV